jgi:hypothetical protein
MPFKNMEMFGYLVINYLRIVEIIYFTCGLLNLTLIQRFLSQEKTQSISIY